MNRIGVLLFSFCCSALLGAGTYFTIGQPAISNENSKPNVIEISQLSPISDHLTSDVLAVSLAIQNLCGENIQIQGISRTDCTPLSISDDPPFNLAAMESKTLTALVDTSNLAGSTELPIVVFTNQFPFKVNHVLRVESIAVGEPTLAPPINK